MAHVLQKQTLTELENLIELLEPSLFLQLTSEKIFAMAIEESKTNANKAKRLSNLADSLSTLASSVRNL